MNKILYVGEHPKTFDVRWHNHDYWELVYCTSGQGIFQLDNGSEIPYHQGQTVIIPPRQVHMNSSLDGFTNIHLQMASPTFPCKNAFIVDDTEDSLKNAFTQARFYYHSDIQQQNLILTALGDLIISYIIVFQNWDKEKFSEPVRHIHRDIIQHFDDPDYALDTAIRQMPFQYDYLRKLFKKEMGLTPLEYMTRLRMKKAEAMLSAGVVDQYSVSEIAEGCGFRDALYFSRVFKKHFGCSPSAFIKKLKAENSASP